MSTELEDDLPAADDDAMSDFNFDDILETPESTAMLEGDDGMSDGAVNDAAELETAPLEETQPAEETQDVALGIRDYVGDENWALRGIDGADNIGFLRMYDGEKNYQSYDLSRDFTSGDFAGSPENDTIHINAGFDTYGWMIAFANGVNMSLSDVREYQLRNGSLPFASGSVMYGSSVLNFTGVKRIVVFESVKYFSYGA
ncbi:MAG: hypothetical protein IJ184_05455 [Alphaproteobacteria bacterium]|nr:hypothetical protein [Alphaproteobacteria bacterium]